jgi:hypothetical protein
LVHQTSWVIERLGSSNVIASFGQQGDNMQARRFEMAASVKDRLVQQSSNARDKARTLPPGKEREGLMRLARQTEIASHLDAWLDSPGLRRPV